MLTFIVTILLLRWLNIFFSISASRLREWVFRGRVGMPLTGAAD